MTLAIALIALPILFNVFYFALIARFSYPAILRKPTAEILERFRAGGTGLVLLWWGFAMSAVAFIPVAILAGGLVADDTLRTAVVTVGVLAFVGSWNGKILRPGDYLLSAQGESGQPKTAAFTILGRHRHPKK